MLARTPTPQHKKANLMGQLRTAKAADLGAFPGSTFVVDDTPPIAQCQEAQIDEANAAVVMGSPLVTKVGAFAGLDLAGKEVSSDLGPPNNGAFLIISNTDDVLTTVHTYTVNDPTVAITVHDAGETFLTRNESSFQRFTENEGKAHTTKGGQLFVDVAAGPMAGACSDTFDPQ